jgi:death-on-curing protein
LPLSPKTFLALRSFEPHSALDVGKLESALGRPMHTYDGAPLCPTVVGSEGALLQGLAQAHAFEEGNKLTAWLCATSYLATNGFVLRRLDAETSGQFVLSVVNHELDLQSETIWLAARLNP